MKIGASQVRAKIIRRSAWLCPSAIKSQARPTIAAGRHSGRIATACSLASILLAVPTATRAERLSVADFTKIAARCGPSVAPSTLAAVAKTESGFRTFIVSDNNSHRAREFTSIDEAAALANNLIAQGHSIDLGLMQINSANLRRLGYTTRDALDPCKSVSGGALILSRNYASVRNVSDPQIALRHALSQYNTGNIRNGYRNGYVHRVEQSARALLAAVTNPSAVSVATVAITRAAAPMARQVFVASWNVWEGAGHSVAPRATSRAENFLVF